MQKKTILELFLRVTLITVLILSVFPAHHGKAANPSQNSPTDKALTLLGQLTPEEKVGQLVLVTFKGDTANTESLIYDLITNHHVGGVVFRRSNDNFIGPEGTISAAWELIKQLQNIEWQSAQTDIIDPESNSAYRPNYIPLFIGISQEGDGYPYSEILNGISPLPNQMTLGATWQPEYADLVGQILGRELSAIGFNLLFGPSLDILEDPNSEDTGNLGTRSFGGDPYWVGKFGQAYIRGVHQGSQNRITLVGKYFPGRGSSDRSPEEEVATIRKTLEQLKQTDLAPFFAVTGDAPNPESTIDALLTSHIKYQGFQSNIRSTTRPISFDPQAFNQLMGLPAFSLWRNSGGIMVSDDLGSRAVRRFFSPSGEVFNARFVARDALLAGNDLLFLGDILDSEDADVYTTVIRILEFFSVKYREDPAFSQRVDDAVLRILTEKFELYPDFNITNVEIPHEGIEVVGNPVDELFEISQQASTLISPSAEELDNVLPDPPALSDRIVFFTDSYNIHQCTTCPEQPVLEVNTLQDAVLRLYGPESGAQTTRRNLLSYSFENLQTMLDLGINRTDIEFHIKNAQWVVIAMLDVREDRENSLALKRFLDERPDLLRGKSVIVFSLNAPFYLDATDISKLTAYYALYSKTPQSIEVAARLLFNEIRPLPGDLPVSVSGAGYDLYTATYPTPDQTIKLYLDLPNIPAPPINQTGTPEPLPEFRAGDLVPVRTGIILDQNGNPVPDNTEVRFYLSSVGERATILKEVIGNTTDGIARATFPIETQGNLAITARSDPALQSDSLSITVAGERPTETPTESIGITPTITNTSTPTPPIIIGNMTSPIDEGNRAQFINWLMAVSLAIIISWIVYRMNIVLGNARWSMRISFSVMIGGLLLYIYSTIGLPGGEWIYNFAGIYAGGLTVLLGGAIGLLVAFAWKANVK
jgi:beta-N-acetylhexosaminidase